MNQTGPLNRLDDWRSLVLSTPSRGRERFAAVVVFCVGLLTALLFTFVIYPHRNTKGVIEQSSPASIAVGYPKSRFAMA